MRRPKKSTRRNEAPRLLTDALTLNFRFRIRFAANQTIGVKLGRSSARPAAIVSPPSGERRRIENLRKPRTSAWGRSSRQSGARKEARLLDFPVGLAFAEHGEIADHVDRDMVSARWFGVEKKAVERRRPLD